MKGVGRRMQEMHRGTPTGMLASDGVANRRSHGLRWRRRGDERGSAVEYPGALHLPRLESTKVCRTLTVIGKAHVIRNLVTGLAARGYSTRPLVEDPLLMRRIFRVRHFVPLMASAYRLA